MATTVDGACPELNTSSESRVAVVNNTLRIDVPTYNGRDEPPPDLVNQVLEAEVRKVLTAREIAELVRIYGDDEEGKVRAAALGAMGARRSVTWLLQQSNYK